MVGFTSQRSLFLMPRPSTSSPSPLGEGGVGVLRLAHAIDRSGVREIHCMVRALLHVQQATRRPGSERGVRTCWRDDPHPTVEGAKYQVSGKLGRPSCIDEGGTSRNQGAALSAVIGRRLASRAGGRRQRMAVPVTVRPLIALAPRDVQDEGVIAGGW